MRIKICGVTRSEDALCALDAGADMIGFIFVPGSKRLISPEAAGRIIEGLPHDVLPVGVFVNASRTTVLETIRISGIRAVQLHGDEPPPDAEGLPVRVFKAHRVKSELDPAALLRYRVDAHVLDTYVSGAHGGTGQVFDWRFARSAARAMPVILGGGLTPENVADAITIVNPAAVDVSSGVEVMPGIKDHHKIRLFVRAARRAFDEHSHHVG